MPLLLDTPAPIARPTLRLGVLAGPLLVAAFTLFNAAYVAWWCPHDLAPDEAHYWDWSRQLDYGYYSKGPLIAWLIRGGCTLFGDTSFGVRSVAVVCGGLLTLGLWRLTLNVTGSHRTATLVLLAALSHPAAVAVGGIATIDGPFLACWAWALVAAFGKRWTATGLLVALGTLAKPTMLLFPACVLLLVLLRPEWRSRKLWTFFGTAFLGLIPLVAWNAAHDWVSVRHTFGHAGNGGDPTPWSSPLAFVGGQAALLLGVWFVAWVRAAWRLPWRTDTASAFLWCLSVPVFAVFLLASVRTAGEPNWPAPAYLSGAVLIARWLMSRTSPPETNHPTSPLEGEVGEGEARTGRGIRTATHPPPAGTYGSDDLPLKGGGGGLWRAGLTAMIVLGVAVSVVVRWPWLVRPTLAELLPPPVEHAAPPIRRLDPSARLAGWRTLAEAVDEVRADLNDPVIVTMAWTVPGELAFYCDGHPTVYTFAPAVGDRFSQYDLWRPNPVADAQAFRGRTFVYVGTELPVGVFERIERVRRVTHSDGGVPVAGWDIWVGRGFRGFDPPDTTPRY